VVAALKPCTNQKISDLAQQTDVAARYDDTADKFDSEVGLSEWLMGIIKMRKRLARQCKGHVLEVSCGTGRNLGYFDLYHEGSVESLTFVDLSTQMIDVCKKKWAALYTGKEKILRQGLLVRFLPASALEKLPLAPAVGGPKKYDTIIQTMGLCSTPNPGELIANMVEHLDTSNPDARIILLEHGRSYREWLNNILDSSAQKHAELHGCWYNREIGTIISEAAQRCGLVLVRERRHHFGTTWEVELKPAKVTAPRPIIAPVEQVQTGSMMQWVKGLFSKSPDVSPPVP
jgi:methyltransferase OMS1